MIDSATSFSKRNVLIGGGVVLLALGAGMYIYTRNQKALYQQIWDAVGGNTADLSKGLYGDWRDVYDLDSWSPAYLNTAGISPATVDYDTAKADAIRIYGDKGYITDNRADVVSVFDTFKNKTDMATVAKMFEDLKYGSLKDYMKSFMEGGITSKNYMQDIYNFLLTLPK